MFFPSRHPAIAYLFLPVLCVSTRAVAQPPAPPSRVVAQGKSFAPNELLLSRQPDAWQKGLGWLIVEPYSTGCEIHRIVQGRAQDGKWRVTLADNCRRNHRNAEVLWAISPTWNVTLFGAVGDGVADDTAAIQATLRDALRRGKGPGPNRRVVVPPGAYAIHAKGLLMTSGARLELEPGAIFLGPQRGRGILFQSVDETHSIHVQGGEYRQCQYVWRHDGDGSLNSCRFEDLQMSDCTEAFHLASSVGNLWSNCRFGGGGVSGQIDRGIHFTATGVGGTNMNTIVACKFRNWTDRALLLAEGTSNNKSANSVQRCWFENDESCSQAQGAILLSGYTTTFTIRDNYFENTGAQTATASDIAAEPAGTAPIANVIVDGNVFGPSPPSVTHRVRWLNQSSGTLSHNSVKLRKGQRFAYIDTHAFPQSVIRLSANHLMGPGVRGNRTTALYEATEGSQVQE